MSAQNRRKAVIKKKLYLTGVAKILHPGSVAYCALGRAYIWKAYGLQNIQREFTRYEKTEFNELETYEYTHRIVNTEVSSTCPICNVPRPDSKTMNFKQTNVETTKHKI